VSGQLHAPATIPRGNGHRCPLGRKLGGPQTRSGRYGEEKAAGPLASGTRSKKRFYLYFNCFVFVLEPKSNDVLSNIEAGRAIAPGTSRRLPTAVAWVRNLVTLLGYLSSGTEAAFSYYSDFPCQLSFHQMPNTHHYHPGLIQYC
jgi:hypothetical protein